ncbi:MAG: hypothetical protein A2V66_10465 [Ignavibacteria bacterium RBG_13_36_8]|nr:MAG: hypothetical protein A2V66_10465 [Ignavibacteria bacterium RBG_13_36_8]
MKELTKIEEILLLAIWRLKKDAYGVKIRQHVSTVINKDFSYGHLYDALSQLEKKEFVQRELGEVLPNQRGRRKNIYSVTELGFAALRKAREVNEAIWDGIPRFAFNNRGDNE